MNISKKSIILILKILESTLEKWRSSVKEMQRDNNCDLQTYEDLVDKCAELEYTMRELEECI
jgi:hypothetical protein|tara:strand:+ start:195 stop:380 length:186 start_codon:yes stop_codon:yes gene_type:complete